MFNLIFECCLVFTVDVEILSLDWASWQLVHHAAVPATSRTSKCTVLRDPSGDIIIFFLSGDLYSLGSGAWSTVPVPYNSFNPARKHPNNIRHNSK